MPLQWRVTSSVSKKLSYGGRRPELFSLYVHTDQLPSVKPAPVIFPLDLHNSEDAMLYVTTKIRRKVDDELWVLQRSQ
jgi:hypothetical protein